MECPKCGNAKEIWSTMMGMISVGKPCKDNNIATCSTCGHKGKAWEFGAPDCPPMKGTENWDEERIAIWNKDMKEGKIGFKTVASNKGVQLAEFNTDTKPDCPDSMIVLGD